MNITVIGTGFVGVVSAGIFNQLGHQVFGLDIDPKKIDSLNQGKIPFFEPGLKELINQGLKTGSLAFTTNYKQAISSADIIIIAVGTPSAPDGQADLTYVIAAAKSLAPHLKSGAIVALKSTVPPKTNQLVEKEIHQLTKTKFHTASLPEFLKEGSAVHDALHPDRVVIGATDPEVINTLTKLHQPLNAPTIITKPASAQMSKYAANAYLAQRITFINQIANLCEKNGADVQEVATAMGHDARIGRHYWYPGLGYGGSCFPKDVKELAAYSKAVGEGNSIFVKIDELNEDRIPILLRRFGQKIDGWRDKKVALLGLSFKPNTDDIRQAPSLKVGPLLRYQGAKVVGYDPKANQAFSQAIPEITVAKDPYQAAKNSDVVILLIEWDELVNLDLSKLKSAMKGHFFIDTRNQYNPHAVAQAGLKYLGIGR